MDVKRKLNRYIEDTLGESIHWIQGGTPQHLPQHIKLSYQFFKGRLLGTECLFVIGKAAKQLPVPTLEKQIELLKELTQIPLVLAFDKLPTRTAERLIKRKLSFVVIERQLYLPFLLIHLKKEPAQLYVGLTTKSLSPAAETILIGQLLDGRFEEKSGAEISKTIEDSVMTVSKAVRELEEHGYCQLETRGRKKLLLFKDRLSLWQSARKTLRNPVQITRFSNSKPNINWLFSGVSALARHSLLAEDKQQSIAIYRRDILRSKKLTPHLLKESEGMAFKVEIWNRKPWIFSTKGVIDPISLYLTMRSDEDERVQSELEGIMKKIGLPTQGEPNG